jgi:IS1 family transposase
MAHAVVHPLTLVLAPGCLLVFTCDGLNLYFYALTAHFGQWSTDPTTGQVCWQVAHDLIYGQVKKSYRRRKLQFVERLMRLGDLPHLTERLKTLGLSGSLNTAFVERLNLTLRHALAALSRRSCGPRPNSLANSSPSSNGGAPASRIISAVRRLPCGSNSTRLWRVAVPKPRAALQPARPPWRPALPTMSGRCKSCWRFPWARSRPTVGGACLPPKNRE